MDKVYLTTQVLLKAIAAWFVFTQIFPVYALIAWPIGRLFKLDEDGWLMWWLRVFTALLVIAIAVYFMPDHTLKS